MSSRTKANAYSASNVDTVVLQELTEVSEVGIYGDLQSLVLFVKKNNLIKAIKNISYFGSINDIGQVARNSKHLANVLGYINYCIHDSDPNSKHLAVKLALLEERDRVVEFYSELCNNHLKTIYKLYGMRKPLAVISLTGILLALVEYKNHAVLSTFQDTFDFNHLTLAKILVPTKDEFEKNIVNEFSMRYAVMDLWMAICAKSNSAFRKSQMTNFKIMNNFWKHVDMERYETLLKIIKFLDTYVLSETSFKRSTKCQILNENFLYSFRNLFALVTNENVRSTDTDELEFELFKTTFVDFMDVLVSDQAKGITFPQNELGFPLVVNNKTFKINNKLIYTLLTALKSWESPEQLQYCLNILNANLELVAPYMNWIVASSGGYHEPTLSSRWIGHTLLYTSILKSSFPAKADTISLAPLSKNSLTECLSFPNDLVKQLGLQLILLQLIRVASAPSQLLIESVLGNLPTQANFAPLLTSENKLIRLCATMIIKRMEDLVPSFSSSATVSIINQKLAEINVDGCDSFEIVFLDNYLSIQSNNELKWWNKTANRNSFFTSLLKLSKVEYIKLKMYHILEKLTRTSFIFGNNNLIESPLLMLVESISKYIGTESFDQVWKCIDESIARAMKTPYKYLDMAHSKYDDINVFVVILIEQLTFIPEVKNATNILKWIHDFMLKLIIIGESQKALERLAKEKGFNLLFDMGNVTIKENIISKFDFAEAIVVLNQSLLKPGENLIFEIISKMGNYLLSSDSSVESLFATITNPNKILCFTRVASTSMSANDALTLSLFSELFQQLGKDFSVTDLNAFIFNHCKVIMPKRNQQVISKFLWMLSDDQIAELASFFDNEVLVVNVFKIICARNIDMVPNFEKLSKIKSKDLQSILEHFKDSVTEVADIISNPTFFFLLDRPNAKVSEYILKSESISDDVLYRIAPADSDVAEKYKDLVVRLAIAMGSFIQSLKIFSRYTEWFDNSVIELVFDYVAENPKVAMTAEFTHFVTLYVEKFEVIENDSIKLWIQRAMIYVSKKFAESSELSSNFDGFLAALRLFFKKLKQFGQYVSSKVLSTQFEVLLGHQKWATEEKYLAYANEVLMNLDRKGIDSDKLLQIFVTNEHNALRKFPGLNDTTRFQSALLIFVLFNLVNSPPPSLTLTNQLLQFYLGTSRAEDLLIKDVLTTMEAATAKSWISNVTNWEFTDELSQKDIDLVGEDRLIIKDKSNLVVALNKGFVTNTVKNMQPVASIPKGGNYEKFLEFSASCFSGCYQESRYDPEFLILVILNNKELVEEVEGKVKFHLSKIIDSGLMQFIVSCLAIDKVREISKVILYGMLKYINNCEEHFKDANIIKIYVSTILHTLQVSDHKSPIVWHFIGEFANIVTNPGHYLYERVTRYILSTPVIKPYEIPLYKTINAGLDDDSTEEQNYYKQASWLIELLTNGIVSSEDMKILRYREAIEWALNLSNSSYAPGVLKSTILRFINVVQSFGVEGTDLLVTKFAGFSSLELLKRSLEASNFSSCYQSLNIDQITLKTGIVARSQKRVREWADDDVAGAVKRVQT